MEIEPDKGTKEEARQKREALEKKKRMIEHQKWIMKMYADEEEYPRDQPEGQHFIRAKAIGEEYDKECLEASPKMQKDAAWRDLHQAKKIHVIA